MDSRNYQQPAQVEEICRTVERWHAERDRWPGKLVCDHRWWQLKYMFMFTSMLGEMIQFDEHMFQMGWFNHQVDDQVTT